MKFLIRFSPVTGWVCKVENPICKYCKEDARKSAQAWLLTALNCLVCNECFNAKRKAGVLWDIGQAIPVKIVDEIPRELQDDDPKRQW